MAISHDDVMAAVGTTWFRCADRGVIFEFAIKDCDNPEEELSDRADMGEARRIQNALKDSFPSHNTRLMAQPDGLIKVTITKAEIMGANSQTI